MAGQRRGKKKKKKRTTKSSRSSGDSLRWNYPPVPHLLFFHWTTERPTPFFSLLSHNPRWLISSDHVFRTICLHGGAVLTVCLHPPPKLHSSTCSSPPPPQKKTAPKIPTTSLSLVSSLWSPATVMRDEYERMYYASSSSIRSVIAISVATVVS